MTLTRPFLVPFPIVLCQHKVGGTVRLRAGCSVALHNLMTPEVDRYRECLQICHFRTKSCDRVPTCCAEQLDTVAEMVLLASQ